jgi:hypothetical protein
MANQDYDRNELHRAVGEAMEAYANVEATLASLLGTILNINFQKAHIIFFSVGNARSRLDMIEHLLKLRLKAAVFSKLEDRWDSITEFLLTLAGFRNAIAHWHPHTNIYERNSPTGESEFRMVPALGNPILGKSSVSLEVLSFPPFLTDCNYIRGELSGIIPLAKKPPRTLPKRFWKPIDGQNQAVLRPPPTAKAPQPRRPPSKPKLSPAQKRAKAKKDARKAAKRAD